MRKKTISLTNCEGHQYDPRYGTAWSDTWATYFTGKRKKATIGPCIMCRSDCGDTTSIPEGEWDFCMPYGDNKDGMPNILANSPTVTKGVIEQAIAWYLKMHCGVTAPLHFRWKNNDCSIVYPFPSPS